ncbi:hypothetical protein [Streptomyces cyaneus]|uniref:hypothetical protein n=1 Tax=Streptomyces cyaneus TaxID=1904 RepID=UPI001FE9EDC0|nr:hypothetical protein [Streptomyces cyaneus]
MIQVDRDFAAASASRRRDVGVPPVDQCVGKPHQGNREVGSRLLQGVGVLLEVLFKQVPGAAANPCFIGGLDRVV